MNLCLVLGRPTCPPVRCDTGSHNCHHWTFQALCDFCSQYLGYYFWQVLWYHMLSCHASNQRQNYYQAPMCVWHLGFRKERMETHPLLLLGTARGRQDWGLNSGINVNLFPVRWEFSLLLVYLNLSVRIFHRMILFNSNQQMFLKNPMRPPET